jgi:hypothetical protein
MESPPQSNRTNAPSGSGFDMQLEGEMQMQPLDQDIEHTFNEGRLVHSHFFNGECWCFGSLS